MITLKYADYYGAEPNEYKVNVDGSKSGNDSKSSDQMNNTLQDPQTRIKAVILKRKIPKRMPHKQVIYHMSSRI